MERFTTELCQRVELVDVFSHDMKTDKQISEAERFKIISIRVALTPIVDRMDEAGCAHRSPLFASALVSGLFFLQVLRKYVQ